MISGVLLYLYRECIGGHAAIAKAIRKVNAVFRVLEEKDILSDSTCRLFRKSEELIGEFRCLTNSHKFNVQS